MTDEIRLALLVFVSIAMVVDIYLHWPTPRKVLEYENRWLKNENNQNNQIINDLKMTINNQKEKYAQYVLKTDAEISKLNKLVHILAKMQGIDNIDSLLEE